MKKIIIPVLLAFTLLMSSCMSFSSFEEMASVTDTHTTEKYEYHTNAQNTTTVYVETTGPQENTTVPVFENTTAAAETTVPQVTEPVLTRPSENTTAPIVIIPETTAEAVTDAPTKDYSSYTKKQIIDEYAAALNKTRQYQGAVTVDHTEAFNADIKDAHPGGALTELLASNIVKLVGSEGQQTLNFSNGKAVNKDGETVPVLLPQRTDFSLPESGAASADIREENGRLHIKIVLVPETVSMGQVPAYNASAIGYLDTSEMSFSIITISRVDISYTGSVIDAFINSDGFIESVTYTINMSTYAELSGMGISGYGTLEGAQTEKWVLKW